MNIDKEELDDLYQTLVLEHSKRPRNFGSLTCSCNSNGKNPSCGDLINLYVMEENNVIKDIKFQGEGCALCIASTSILTETMKGKNIVESTELTSKFIDFITKDSFINNQKLMVFGGVKNFPLRVKCVLLGWRTFEDILGKIKNGNCNK